jgi:3beta-hydroxy-delta5-steroid dehydrogenase/steroid delta-isomerase
MLNALIDQLRLGRVIATIGDGNAVQDNTYIDNLVHGQLLAADALVKGNAACGKAYFITDNEPLNNFEFFRPIIEGLGFRYPTLKIPRSVMMPIAIIWQYLHFTLGLPKPALSPKEVDKVAVTHFANINDARRDLGYQPVTSVAQAMERCLPYCRQYLQGN